MNNAEESNHSRKIFWVVGAGVVIAGLAFSLWRNPQPEAADPAPAASAATVASPATAADLIELSPEAQQSARLRVAEVSQRPVEKTLAATGRVTPNQHRTAHMYPLARGIVEQVPVQLGDSVEAGAPLLHYDSIELGELLHQFQSARAELERATVQAEVTKSSLARAESLLAVEAISRKEYELREAEHRQAVAAIRSQHAELAQVEGKIRRHGYTEQQLAEMQSATAETPAPAARSVLKAPFAGLIVKLDAARGEIVETDREVITLADTSVVWLLADIYEKDLGQLQAGQPCRARVPAYPEEVFTGEVTYLGGLLDPQTRTSKLRCEVRNADKRLKLEMFATVEIPLAGKRTAAAVPESAVQRIGTQAVVFVPQGDSHFEKREVELGEQFGEWIEVRSGIAPAEKVVTEGAFYLKSAFLSEQISGEGEP